MLPSTQDSNNSWQYRYLSIYLLSIYLLSIVYLSSINYLFIYLSCISHVSVICLSIIYLSNLSAISYLPIHVANLSSIISLSIIYHLFVSIYHFYFVCLTQAMEIKVLFPWEISWSCWMRKNCWVWLFIGAGWWIKLVHQNINAIYVLKCFTEILWLNLSVRKWLMQLWVNCTELFIFFPTKKFEAETMSFMPGWHDFAILQIWDKHKNIFVSINELPRN